MDASTADEGAMNTATYVEDEEVEDFDMEDCSDFIQPLHVEYYCLQRKCCSLVGAHTAAVALTSFFWICS
eukprot:SAG31_NODE_28285_length_412_cov_0.990415_1_plen_69_part_10